jgi:hypothetical protein
MRERWEVQVLRMAKGIVLVAPPEGTQRVFPAPLAIQLAGKKPLEDVILQLFS